MYAVSNGFLDALHKSHKVTARAELLEDGSFLRDIDIVSGSVTVDENAAQRRALNCVIVDPTGALTPATFSDPLAPAGNELRVWRGIETPTLTEEVPLGVFGIADLTVSADTTGGASLVVKGFDRSKKVEESRFTEPYYQVANSSYDAAISFIIVAQAGGVFQGSNPQIQSISTQTSAMVFNVGDDPWATATELARSVGCSLYFDPLGNLILKTTPDPDTAPITLGYAEGTTAVILDGSKKLTRQYTYNGVVAVGESSAITDQQAAPVAAVAWDDNPASPTYYLGKFGKKPRFYSSPFIKTRVQAAAAASALLQVSKGMAEDVRFTAVVNPAHEAGDVVSITLSKSKIDARYVLSTFFVPLTYADALSASTRRRTT